MGQATFLDYKKRALPVQTKDLVKQLTDPELATGRGLKYSRTQSTLLSTLNPQPLDHI